MGKINKIFNDHDLNSETLQRSFYNRHTILVAIDLLGKLLTYKKEKEIIAGKIVEVEAYLGIKDPSCHAYVGKTNRSKIFWEMPGIAYVFLNYGIHHCLNAITEKPNIPGCVLIRAVEPVIGIETMKNNRNKTIISNLTNGPGKLTQAYGITLEHNRIDLTCSNLRICDFENGSTVLVTSRIGISKAKNEPLRFCEKNNPFVSNQNKKLIHYIEGHANTVKKSFLDETLKVNL